MVIYKVVAYGRWSRMRSGVAMRELPVVLFVQVNELIGLTTW